MVDLRALETSGGLQMSPQRLADFGAAWSRKDDAGFQAEFLLPTRKRGRAENGVLGVRIYREPGYIFVPLRRGSDRAGAVLAVGADRDDAVRRARRAAEHIRFEAVDAEALV